MELLLNIGFSFAGILASVIFFLLGKRQIDQILEKLTSVQQRAHNFVDDVRKVDEAISDFINEENSTGEIIEKVVESNSGWPRDTWLKLLLIRIILRGLLRRMTEVHGISVSKPTAGIRTLKNTLAAEQVIDATLNQQVERIRDATFTIQWPEGDPPDPQNVQYTLENYKDVFASLKERMRST